jgi:hypothetical protein
VTGANDAAPSHNSDPQFLIIFCRHVSNALSILRNRWPLARDKFDRAAGRPFNPNTNGRDGPLTHPRWVVVVRPAAARSPAAEVLHNCSPFVFIGVHS